MLCLYCPIPLSFPSSKHGPCSCKSRVPISRYFHGTTLCWPSSPSCSTMCPLVSYFEGGFSWSSRRRGWSTHVRASMRESPYDVLGVSSSATPQQIKRAYRKLALKYHPDVNKEANAQEKFMRIKHAYNTLTNPNKRSDYSGTTQKRSKSWRAKEEEEFYGLGDFFRDVQITIGDFFQDLQVEFQNWEASTNSQEQPKSLWEELADIGEEFVEFLEKELNITDTDSGNDNRMPQDRSYYDKNEKKSGENMKNEAKKSSIEDNIDEIEDALAQLRKELGL